MNEKTKTINEKELEILDFWEKDKTFEKSLEKTKNSKPYIFYDGPPFATGTPHYGHLLGSIIKDIYGRFWTMNNRYVRRVWGWDCHGLPIENLAEQGLKINSKNEIESMGVKKFNDFCRSKVLGYTDEWEKVIKRIGRWVDMKNSYKTMDNSYIESVWWTFSELWKKGYIYQGEKILMYCPRCSTPLAKAEIAMDNSYKNIKEDTIVVKFKLKDEDVYALAWTTTPWTLPSNLALTVNPEMDYVYLNDKSDGTIYLLAKELISKFYKHSEDYEIIKELKGKELDQTKYEPLFDYFKDTQNAFKFILGNFVTSEEGTGIVHTAPAFGEDDYQVCKENSIPIVQPVDEKGSFTDEVKDFKGRFIHDTNQDIIQFLKNQGKVILIKKMSHEYPFCYRCDTKLMYRAIPAWFINIQKIKPRLLELNEKLNWYPKFLKDGRVKYNIETAPDWNISRNRYWATAIPIWQAKDGEKLVISSIEELKRYAKKMPKGKIDLHKDYLDKVILEKNKKEFKRIPEVLDCWFESGSMTFAQFHYPFENKEFFEKNFPAQFVAEYIGQVRAWFYYMNVISAILFDDIPFENVVVTGNILAKDSQKMSKSKNNFTDPMILIEKYGVDAIRFYLSSCQVMNADNLNFSDQQVEEIYKKVLVILENVTSFYKLNNNIPDEELNPKNIMDKWILSRLNETAKNIDLFMKDYNTIQTCSEIKEFIEDLSTWYVRQTRERFNEKDIQAKATLKYTLEKLSIIIAPIIPFISEIIYQTINKNKESVHLANWFNYDENLIDQSLTSRMKIIREIVSRALKIRDQKAIGLKWPLPKITIFVKSGFGLENLTDIIKDQINVKEVIISKAKETELSIELDTTLNPELEAEGFTREIIRKIQDTRKKAKLVKEDLINLIISTDFDKMLKENQDSISEKVGAKTIIFEKKEKIPNYSESGFIKGKAFSFWLKKV